MNLALFASASAPLNDVAALLRSEGVEVSTFTLKTGAQIPSLESMEKGVLIFREQGAGPDTQRVSFLLGDERALLLCTRQIDDDGRQLLMDLGAAAVIAPRTWEAEDIAERILAQLIMDGDVTPNASGELKGATRVMRERYKKMESYARMSDPMLILGESGTGKELVARETHRLSRRTDQFVWINCAELSKDLMPSQLFGYEKGAFTGADKAHKGLLAMAGRGTVLLDEIGLLTPESQGMLLRVLEQGEMRPVGGTKPQPMHARFLLATNRDLAAACDAEQFKRDLFERIRSVKINLPPLCERRADIPLLVWHFVSKFSQEHGQDLQMPSSGYDYLFDCDWSNGNVRALRGVVRSAAALAGPDGLIRTSDLRSLIDDRRKETTPRLTNLPKDRRGVIPFDPNVDKWNDVKDRAQSIYFRSLLEATGGNKEKAQLHSGLGHTQFYEKLKEERLKDAGLTDIKKPEA